MGNPIRYDYASISLTTGQTDYDVKANVAALFSNVPVGSRVIIETNQDISVRFNNTVLPAFPLTVNDSPFQLPPNYVDITNIFLSNSSGSTATVKIWLF